MKTVGLIGGLGPESTIEYYRWIFARYREMRPDGSAPSIIINSIDVNKVLALAGEQRLIELTQYLGAEVQKLVGAGADFAALAANTPHIVFDEVQESSSIPLLSIVETTCESAKAQGLSRVGLFGTRFTMQAGFYQHALSKRGITVVLPEADDQDYIHGKYMNELLRSVFLDETRDQLLRIVERLKQREGIQGLILGGTELPLLLKNSGDSGIPFLDTTRIHVAAIVQRMLA